MSTPEERPIILIIEDDRSIIDAIRVGMEPEGFRIEIALDGPTGLAKTRMLQPHMIILDINLPGVNGFDICRQLRNDPNVANIPILMLTARDDLESRVMGLEQGADDYLTKPYEFKELLARTRALLRRQQRVMQINHSGILKFEDVTLDESTREVKRGDHFVQLTVTEFNLLRLFMMHPKQVLDRATILDRVWGYDFQGETNIIEVYVRYLREKLEDDPGNPRLIQTVRGVGYVLRGS